MSTRANKYNCKCTKAGKQNGAIQSCEAQKIKSKKAEIDTANYITQARDDREKLVSNKFLHKGKAGGLQFEWMLIRTYPGCAWQKSTIFKNELWQEKFLVAPGLMAVTSSRTCKF